MEEVAGVRRRSRKVAPDRVEHRFVPDAGDGVAVEVGARAAGDQVRRRRGRASQRDGVRGPDRDDPVGREVGEVRLGSTGIAHVELGDGRRGAEAEEHPRIL